MRVVVLAGGVGGARFLRGLRHLGGHDITAVVNTADDITLHGLRICPDLDTVTYTLGGGIDEDRGWGRTDETFVVKEELARYGEGPDWFGLGDRDLATHLIRTRLLAAGHPLSAVTERLCERWRPGVRILPMTDDTVETHVTVDRGDGPEQIHFQEWWIRHGAALPALDITPLGADKAVPAPGVLEAISAADTVVFAPSNPVVSIGPILAVPGIRDAVAAARTVGLSPIVGGAPVRGMADACLTAIGVATSAQAVGRHYGHPLLDGWLVDTVDTGARVPGVTVRAVPLLMTDLETTAAMARTALELAVDG